MIDLVFLQKQDLSILKEANNQYHLASSDKMSWILLPFYCEGKTEVFQLPSLPLFGSGGYKELCPRYVSCQLLQKKIICPRLEKKNLFLMNLWSHCTFELMAALASGQVVLVYFWLWALFLKNGDSFLKFGCWKFQAAWCYQSKSSNSPDIAEIPF